ncbi:MAG: hypothetical protein JW971_08720 [Synergistales bacterium]|nr:hypothetical protein [Synergistales bacterium]
MYFRFSQTGSFKGDLQGEILPSPGRTESLEGTGKGHTTSLPVYDIPSRVTSPEDLLPVRYRGSSSDEMLARSLNDPEGTNGTCFDSSDIPPRIRNIADQLMDLKTDLDDSALDTVNSALGHLPLVEVKADSAELRPSGDGIRLKVNIPAENIRIREDEKE